MATNTEPQNADAENLHHVTAADDIEDGERVVVDIEGREIAVFYSNDEYHALSNYCTHQGGPACEGLLSGTIDVDEDNELIWACDDEIVACPWHGWEFDITSGEHLASDDYRLPSYDVHVIDGDLYVEF